MSPDQSHRNDVLPSGPEHSAFFWPGVVRDTAEHRWCAACQPLLKTLIEDEMVSPVFYFTTGDREVANRLTQALSGDLGGLARSETNPWVGARSLLADRRAVVQFLGARLAQQTAGPARDDDRLQVGGVCAIDWLCRVTSLAWADIEQPHWMGPGPREWVRDSGPLERPGGEPSFQLHPWVDDAGLGLQGDLTLFLTEFCAKRLGTAATSTKYSQIMAQACVLLRALAVVAPKRMPEADILLVDEVEGYIDPDILRGKNLVDERTYGVVRAAWDQKILEKMTATGGGGERATPRTL